MNFHTISSTPPPALDRTLVVKIAAWLPLLTLLVVANAWLFTQQVAPADSLSFMHTLGEWWAAFFS